MKAVDKFNRQMLKEVEEETLLIEKLRYSQSSIQINSHNFLEILFTSNFEIMYFIYYV